MKMGYNLLCFGRSILNGFESTYYSLLAIFDPGHVVLSVLRSTSNYGWWMGRSTPKCEHLSDVPTRGEFCVNLSMFGNSKYINRSIWFYNFSNFSNFQLLDKYNFC